MLQQLIVACGTCCHVQVVRDGSKAAVTAHSISRAADHCYVRALVQGCARQNQGVDPVQFPMFYKEPANFSEEPPCGNPVPELFGTKTTVPRKQYHWQQSNGGNQWHIDGFTCDPRVLCKAFKGIRFRFMPQPVSQNAALNASVGSMPSMLVYIAVHKLYGTYIFYPYLGAKGGSQSRKTWEDYEYWGVNITEDELKHINEVLYYNQRPARPAARRAMNAEDFDTSKFNPHKGFRVCSTTLKHAN